MRNRTTIIVSFLLGVAGVLVSAAMWTRVITWEYASSLVGVLLFSSLFALGWLVLGHLRAIRKDLNLVRDRSKSLVENTKRAAERTEEVRRELLLGAYSHIPGQIARMESRIGTDSNYERFDARPSPQPTTVVSAFDEVFVLNLDHDTEKMDRTAEMLTRHGIAFTRFSAVDGTDPAFDDEWKTYIEEGPQLPKERHSGERLIESRGAWGYLKSMQKLLEYVRAARLQRILLLEDDILLHKEFTDRFAEAWSELPHDWKVVYLGSAQVDRAKITRYSDHLHHPGAMAYGSFAVALDASIYDQALVSVGRFDWPFDTGALREIDAAHPKDVFVVDPPLVIADVSRSAIRPGRDMEAHAAKHGWDRGEYEAPEEVDQ